MSLDYYLFRVRFFVRFALYWCQSPDISHSHLSLLLCGWLNLLSINVRFNYDVMLLDFIVIPIISTSPFIIKNLMCLSSCSIYPVYAPIALVSILLFFQCYPPLDFIILMICFESFTALHTDFDSKLSTYIRS